MSSEIKPIAFNIAGLHGRSQYHVNVGGEIFKSQGARGYGGGDSSLHDKKRKECAALIVQSVNHHEKLVEALREAKPLIEELREELWREGATKTAESVYGTLTKINAVLASLERKEG